MSSFYSFAKKETYQTIFDKVAQMEKTSEIEVSINRLEGINVNQYMELVTLLLMLSENGKNEISNDTTLDINYVYDNLNYSAYRISIDGVDKINKIMSSLAIRKNHSIFSILANNIKSAKTDESNLTIMNKVKSKTNTIDVQEYDLRFRISDELPVDDKILDDLIHLQEIERHKINYRYKERLSIIMPINSNYNLRLDLTDVKEGKSINNLASNTLCISILSLCLI